MRYVIAILAALFLLPAAANANVQVRVTADNYRAQILSPDSYTVRVTSDTPITLDSVYFALPDHGRPAIGSDIFGTPNLDMNDQETAWAVTNAHGATQNQRLLTWHGPFSVTPSNPLTFRVDVLTPTTSMWFWSSAGATPSNGVSACAECADIEVVGNTDFGIGTTVVVNGNRAQYTTTISNGTSHDLTVSQLRAGITQGFTFVSSDFGNPTPGGTHTPTLWWREPFVVPAHGNVVVHFLVFVPCGAGSYGMRTKAWLAAPLPSGQALAGTGPTARVRLNPC